MTTSSSLEGDSYDYNLLQSAVEFVAGIDGLICEIGVRRGGSLKYIIDGIAKANTVRTLVAIDPYGNIEYIPSEGQKTRYDYTNEMKNEALPNIYSYVQGKNVNLIFFNLEDTEFFNRFADGVPVYEETKRIINQYALVFFDGPHDVESVKLEIDFFLDKVVKGSVFVFDDVQSYPHQVIHEYVIQHGFEPLDYGVQGRKVSYVKI